MVQAMLRLLEANLNKNKKTVGRKRKEINLKNLKRANQISPKTPTELEPSQ